MDTHLSASSVSQQIKNYAQSLGFDACGFCRANVIDDMDQQCLATWIGKSYHGDMGYMANNVEKRINPQLLVEDARSIVSVALNYYPKRLQRADVPQFAYYAYGKDYHDVMKEKLQQLFDYTKSLVPYLDGRVFCDTAPVMERYFAMKAGIGFVGKNSLLIIPKKGSFFFLGEMMINIELDYDEPCTLSCGNCRRCIDACPIGAIVSPAVIDARRCISYQTIESKGEMEEGVVRNLSNRFYGCDICQLVCPWNRYAHPHATAQFDSSQAFLDLDEERLTDMSVEDYQQVFKGSAVKRTKLSGLKRNLDAWKRSRNSCF